MLKAEAYIDRLELEPHPEGGYYRQIYRAAEELDTSALPERFGGPRAFATSIYFLLKAGQVSRFHRIKSDELWHFYTGSALTIYCLDEAKGLYTLELGPNVSAGEAFQRVVPANTWFGAALKETGFALVGCTVAPGFAFADFELAKREGLLEQFPGYVNIISKLT